MAGSVSDMLSYCEMRSYEEEDVVLEHAHVLPLPILTIRETIDLYLGNVGNVSGGSGGMQTTTTLNLSSPVHESGKRVLQQTIHHLQLDTTTADLEVVALRNLDALKHSNSAEPQAEESRLVGSGPFRAQNLAGGGGFFLGGGFLTGEIFF